VQNITIAGTGKLSATYTKGAASYLHPTLTVVDDQGAASAPAAVQLGITGWEYEIISSANDNFVPNGDEVQPVVTDLQQDPLTGELVAAGAGGNFKTGELTGIFLARRSVQGIWTEEFVDDMQSSLWTDTFPHGASIASLSVSWQANGQPLLILDGLENGPSGVKTRPFYSTRSTGGTWQTAPVPLDGMLPEDRSKQMISLSTPLREGLNGFAAVSGPTNDGTHEHLYVFWYGSGGWQIEDTNLTVGSATDIQLLTGVMKSPTGTYVIPLRNYLNTPFTLGWLRRVAPNDWQVERLDDGTLNDGSGEKFGPVGFTFTKNDSFAFLAARKLTPDSFLLEIINSPNSPFNDISLGNSNPFAAGVYPSFNYSTAGLSVISNYRLEADEKTDHIQTDVVRGSTHLTEEMVHRLPDPNGLGAFVRSTLVLPDGAMWATVYVNGNSTIPESSDTGIQALMHRVDPTLIH
jgi:hypothetical protein